MSVSKSEETIAGLKDLIRKHRVCYEVWPEYLIVGGERQKVGFELLLCGANGHEGGQAVPGREHCRETFSDLLVVAERIMPNESRPSRYEIDPFDRSLHLTPKRQLRPEVTLSIRILHRHGFDQPVDECEEKCLKEMKAKLAELAVLEGECREV